MYKDDYQICKQARVKNKDSLGWKMQVCVDCNGSGRYDSNNSPKCSSCNGIGKERYKCSNLTVI